MLLALDIGNSAVKGGLFDEEELIRVFSVERAHSSTQEKTAGDWQDAFAPHLDGDTVDRIGLVTVVPSTTTPLTDAVTQLTGRPITHVSADMELPFVLDYKTPETLGVDRLAAAAAGWIQYGQPESRSVLVVDVGTAVNYEVVHRDGIYRGGVIAAGPALTREALQHGTAQLPDVSLSLPEHPIGRSTQTAIQSGIMWGLLDSVDSMCSRLTASLPDTPRVVLTGGWSAVVADHLDAVHERAPHLVLYGVRLLTELNE